MSKQPQPQPTGPPCFAVARLVYGRATCHNWPPEAIAELRLLAQKYRIPERNMPATAAPDIT
ncbi:hypothetical protein [Hymenobacter sp. B81]|uniref:hypothetical protein n=1 Tax=Hymenobacter sp. B81 TaxID=3344878 RepID=UPI0037DD835C